MPLTTSHKQNFDTLRRAFLARDVALMECQWVATGQTAAVLCAVNRLADGCFEFVPFAAMLPGNPYEAVNPPNPNGGFYPQEKVHV